MKKVLIFLIFPLFITMKMYAQSHANTIFLTSNDFLTYNHVNNDNQMKSKCKITIGNIFNSSIIKIHKDDTVIKLVKDSVFGYCDKKKHYYRFFNHKTFTVLNYANNIWLYSCTSSIAGPKNNYYLSTEYYFSKDGDSPIYQLTKWNLKKIFLNDLKFLQLLEMFFPSDRDLMEYDSQDHDYYLNHIYQISKM